MADRKAPQEMTDRELMVAILTETRELHAYVEKIETEAHEAMGGLTNPDNMMKMAGQFLGVNPA